MSLIADAPFRSSRRWMLAALLIGFLALHFLGAHDAAGHHRLPSITAGLSQADSEAPETGSTAGTGGAVNAAGTDISVAVGSPAPLGADGSDTACLLTLLVAAAALVFAARPDRTGSASPTWRLSTTGALCRPPRQRRRAELCVERI